MSISNSPPPRFDKEQPTSTPYLVRRPIKKRRSLPKQLIAVGKQRPFLLLFLGLCGLCLAGWMYAPSLSSLSSSLYSLAPSLAGNSPVSEPSVIKSSPQPAPTKLAVAVSATPTATPVATPQPTPQPTLQPTPKTTPTPPATKQANVTPPIEAGTGRFAVQIGAYQEQAEATANLAKMKGQGIDARMISVTLPNKGMWHRVQVGRFETRDAATRFGQQLQARKTIAGFMVTEYQAKSGS